MLRDNVLGMERKHFTPAFTQETDNHARAQFEAFLHAARLHVAALSLFPSLSVSLPLSFLVKIQYVRSVT